MKKYFVVGNPIEHSLSPKLHNYWIKENNIKAVYDKKQSNESDSKEVISEIKTKFQQVDLEMRIISLSFHFIIDTKVETLIVLVIKFII